MFVYDDDDHHHHTIIIMEIIDININFRENMIVIYNRLGEL